MLNRISRALIIGTCLYCFMACNGAVNSRKDPEIVPYINEFIRLSRQVDPDIEVRAKHLSVVFGTINKRYFAEYRPFFNSIVVNKELWQYMPDAEREELIVHEFGHAILGLDHEDNTIMQAQGMLGEKYYTTHYSDLLNIHFGCLVKKCINETYNPLKYSQPKETPVTLKEILENEHAVIRLTATWCPPCKVLAPIFNEIAAEHPDVKVYVIDVDENKDLAGELNVRGIPTCIAIRNNKVDQVMVGAQPKQELEKLFK